MYRTAVDPLIFLDGTPFGHFHSILFGLTVTSWFLIGCITEMVPLLYSAMTTEAWMGGHDGFGWLVGASQIGSLIGNLLGGVMSDVQGRRPVLLTSLLVIGLGCGTLATTTVCNDYAMCCAGIVLVGAGMGGITVTYPALLNEWLPESLRQKWVQRFQMGWIAGGLTAVVVAFLSFPQWRLAFRFLVVPSVLLLVGTLTQVPESPRFLLIKKREIEALEKINFMRRVDGHRPIRWLDLQSHPPSAASTPTGGSPRSMSSLRIPKQSPSFVVALGQVWASHHYRRLAVVLSLLTFLLSVASTGLKVWTPYIGQEKADKAGRIAADEVLGEANEALPSVASDALVGASEEPFINGSIVVNDTSATLPWALFNGTLLPHDIFPGGLPAVPSARQVPIRLVQQQIQPDHHHHLGRRMSAERGVLDEFRMYDDLDGTEGEGGRISLGWLVVHVTNGAMIVMSVKLMEWIGPRRTLQLGLWASVLSCVAILLPAYQRWWVTICDTMVFCAQTTAWVPLTAMQIESFPTSARAAGLGLMQLVNSMGSFLVGPIGSLTISMATAYGPPHSVHPALLPPWAMSPSVLLVSGFGLCYLLTCVCFCFMPGRQRPGSGAKGQWDP
ncbi:unnamed protein product [Vitrella brassicaformis CCMP3155]|uniref:Major facilitator superfamily (MFS) profile domain-containing protein n=3 Tax=Vitrella brassicaformis TaxID=1169539 RepID=A0A0G4G3V6_VITBC|nr:unnamed protein product [Vitrella brassicaformis CCMP3155]|eukprot:CEM22758.1 unnamed protein product [Vitrella brassicaformis CCMP3155]